MGMGTEVGTGIGTGTRIETGMGIGRGMGMWRAQVKQTGDRGRGQGRQPQRIRRGDKGRDVEGDRNRFRARDKDKDGSCSVLQSWRAEGGVPGSAWLGRGGSTEGSWPSSVKKGSPGPHIPARDHQTPGAGPAAVPRLVLALTRCALSFSLVASGWPQAGLEQKSCSSTCSSHCSSSVISSVMSCTCG